MQTAIIYYSQHHGNTKKLLDAIVNVDLAVTLINAAEKVEVDLGSYLCCGWDTYGPFKLIGGLKKDHPTKEEIQGAVEFYNGLGIE